VIQDLRLRFEAVTAEAVADCLVRRGNVAFSPFLAVNRCRAVASADGTRHFKPDS
jgi:hypothetical protein